MSGPDRPAPKKRPRIFRTGQCRARMCAGWFAKLAPRIGSTNKSRKSSAMRRSLQPAFCTTDSNRPCRIELGFATSSAEYRDCGVDRGAEKIIGFCPLVLGVDDTRSRRHRRYEIALMPVPEHRQGWEQLGIRFGID